MIRIGGISPTRDVIVRRHNGRTAGYHHGWTQENLRGGYHMMRVTHRTKDAAENQILPVEQDHASTLDGEPPRIGFQQPSQINRRMDLIDLNPVIPQNLKLTKWPSTQ